MGKLDLPTLIRMVLVESNHAIVTDAMIKTNNQQLITRES
jgi:hypothetical protein